LILLCLFYGGLLIGKSANELSTDLYSVSLEHIFAVHLYDVLPWTSHAVFSNEFSMELAMSF